MKIKEIWDLMIGNHNVFNGSISFREVGVSEKYYTVFANRDMLIESRDSFDRGSVNTLLYSDYNKDREYELFSPVAVVKSGYLKIDTSEESIKSILTDMYYRVDEDERTRRNMRDSKTPYEIPEYIREDKERIKYFNSDTYIALVGSAAFSRGCIIGGFSFKFNSVEVHLDSIIDFMYSNRMRCENGLDAIPYDSKKEKDYFKVAFVCNFFEQDVNQVYIDAIKAIEYISNISEGRTSYEDDFIRKFYYILF